MSFLNIASAKIDLRQYRKPFNDNDSIVQKADEELTVFIRMQKKLLAKGTTTTTTTRESVSRDI